MVIRVAATIAELKANLAEGRNQIETTTAGMGRLAASLSGEKLSQNAHNMVAAVNQIGGASKLTQREQARVNTTLTKAIEKYHVMGKEAPASMVALARATQGAHVPTEGLSTKMVALGSFIGTMAAKAVAALGRLALNGIKALASGISDLVMEGPRLAALEHSFQTLAATLGESGEAMLGEMRAGTQGLVSDLDLMTAANKAVLLGLPVTAAEMGDLSQTATVLGRAMGLGPTQAFDNLITALGRSSPLILDNLGLSVKVGEANTVYAAALGKTVDELTDAERKTAFYNAAMEAARAKVLAIGEANNSLGDSLARTGVWWENFKNDLSIAIARSPVLGAALDEIGVAFSAPFGSDSAARVQTMMDRVNRLAMTVVDAGFYVVEFGRIGVRVFGAFVAPLRAVTAAQDYLTERFVAGIATTAELAATIPGVGLAFAGTARSARSAATAWAATREASSRALTSALDMAAGQGVVHGALAKTTETLVRAKAAMVEASLATDASAAALATTQVPALRQSTDSTEDLLVSSDRLLGVFTGLPPVVRSNAASLQVYEQGLQAAAADAETLVDSMGHVEAALESGLLIVGAVSDAYTDAGSAAVIAASRAELSWGQTMAAVSHGLGTMTGTVQAAQTERQLAAAAATVGGRVAHDDYGNPYIHIPGVNAPGALAEGGPVSRGMPYLVGERGPELFVPNANGTVLPNGAGGTPVTVNVNVGHFIGSDESAAQQLAAMVSGQVMQTLAITRKLDSI